MMLTLINLLQWSVLICQPSDSELPKQECLNWAYECLVYELQSGKSPDDSFETCATDLPVQWP
jgi:hypothetical protein